MNEMSIPVINLRVGNIIQNKSGHLVNIEVSTISGILENIHEYDPILITHELLIKAGFSKIRNHHYVLNKWADYYFLFTGKIGLFYKVGCQGVGTPIKYFHELQNALYYFDETVITFKI